MALRMRRWRAGVLTTTVARRGALVLHYRRGRRSAHVWRAGHGAAAWVVRLTGSGPTVFTAHRWQDARRLARRHVRRRRRD